jgi:dGTPase
VAQLGRSIARSLRINEDLVEAIALAHDMGHTPFGHAGQDTLNQCMADFGGFEHNLQSLRVVDQLEERYPDYDGLNLCFETREGILKHCSLDNAKLIEACEHIYSDGRAGVGNRFLDRTQPSLEAQLCNVADQIAYNAHDVDDGVRSGLITMDQLSEVVQFGEFRLQALQTHAHLAQPENARRLLYETIRLMLSAQVYDLIATTQAAIDAHKPESVNEVRALPALVAFGAETGQKTRELKQFLFKHLYRHPQVEQTRALACRMIQELFVIYTDRPQEMQTGFAVRASQSPAQGSTVQRVVADYIAGMTDRFAAREHERLTGAKLIV